LQPQANNRPAQAAGAADASQRLIGLAHATLEDLRQEAPQREITLDSKLDDDLGLDSLARVELFARIERELGVRLPELLFASAETLRDIAAALAASPSYVAPPTRTSELAAAEASAAPPASVLTLDRLLAWHVERQPQFVQITLCDQQDERISYANLWRRVREAAGALQHYGVRPGDVVALMLPTSADYFGVFYGVLLAGATPAPLYPPTRLSQIEEHVRRHAGILQNCEAAALITSAQLRRMAGLLRMHAPTLRRVLTVDELQGVGHDPAPVNIRPDSIALLQYTSGSTGQPKGVVLTHANILANIAALGTALEIRRDDVFVSWLPLYHDMGLIGAWLGTLYFGLPLAIMSPLSFLTRPIRWLEAVQRFGGTLSAAPNFAYELCVKRISDEEAAALDLSTWRVAMNGAEAVMPRTLERFQERFGRCGLRPTALTPVYGMAEASVGLTVPPVGRGPLIDVIEREPFMKSGVARPARDGDANPLRFPSCGAPLRGHQVRIVDESGRELGERREGRLEFRGPSATHGYFRNPQASAALLRDGWLNSGDRAYTVGGEIYVTGRIKDIIIRAGRHIYPEEIEEAVGALNGVRKGCVAVFGVRDAARGTERLIVMAETHQREAHARTALRQQIMQRVVTLIGEPPDDVVLVAPRTVLKTSSGKLRRAASRELYEAGMHRRVKPRAAWLQIAAVSLSGAARWARRLLQRSIQWLYALWFWSVLGLGAALTYLVTLPLSQSGAWAVAHYAARAFLRLTGLSPRIIGAEHRNVHPACIIAVNHASYLDAIFLISALREPCRFVAKQELRRTPFVGAFLRKLSTEFIERFDTRESVQAADRLTRAVRSGPPCIFFPEGSFTRAPGLTAFRLGAFSAAVAAELPIIPIALQGVRTVLRDGECLPTRAPVTIHIEPAIEPPRARDAFTAAVRLRDATRAAILKRCGEADLG